MEQRERVAGFEARQVRVEDVLRLDRHLTHSEVHVGRQVYSADELAPPLSDTQKGRGLVDAHVRLLLEHVEHAVVHKPVYLARHHAHARQWLTLDVGAVVASSQPRTHEGKCDVVEVALQVARGVSRGERAHSPVGDQPAVTIHERALVRAQVDIADVAGHGDDSLLKDDGQVARVVEWAPAVLAELHADPREPVRYRRVALELFACLGHDRRPIHKVHDRRRKSQQQDGEEEDARACAAVRAVGVVAIRGVVWKLVDPLDV